MIIVIKFVTPLEVMTFWKHIRAYSEKITSKSIFINRIPEKQTFITK